MADRVLPIVRLLFACDSVARDEVEPKWILKNPWAVVTLPEAVSFPFDAEEIWLYAQLAEGVGAFQLSVEVRQLRDNGSERKVGRSEPVEIEFVGGNQLAVIDTVIHMTQVPFDEPGLYQFRIMANYAELKGQVAEIRVLDRRDQVCATTNVLGGPSHVWAAVFLPCISIARNGRVTGQRRAPPASWCVRARRHRPW